MSINLKGPDFKAFRDAGVKGLAGKRKAVGDAQALGKEGKKNLKEGQDLIKAMGKEAARRATDAAIDAAGKATAEFGGTIIAALVKKHKKESLILLLIMIIAGLTPYLFILYLIFGADFLMQQQQQGSTLQITKTGPAAVANGAPMNYHIEASSTGGGDTGGTAAACGKKSALPNGNDPQFSCGGGPGNTANKPSSDGFYTSTHFGCNTGFPKDPNDNCQPGCPVSKIPECNGKNGQACEEAVQWYSANAGIYGCGAVLKVTNPTTGKAIIVRAIDYGPSCSVQSGRQKFDLSQKASQALGGDGIVKVEKVSDSTALGAAQACTATAGNVQLADQTQNVSTDIRAVAAAASLSVDLVLIPKDKDTYVINQATVSQTGDGITIIDTIPTNALFKSATGSYTTDPPQGGAGTKTVIWTSNGASNSAGTATGVIPPNTNTCGGKYTLKNPLGKNFGDPDCSLKTNNDIYTEIQKIDPKNVDVIFHKIIPCEGSGYNPNAYTTNGWGLFQQAKGIGDVDWKTQISKMVNANTDITTFGHCAQ